MKIEDAKAILISDYLQLKQIEPKRKSNRNYYYLSPLRDEKTSSFKVDIEKNLWIDFGLGIGGSIIDLVISIGDAKNISEAIQYLNELNIVTPLIQKESTKNKVSKVKPESSFNILENKPLQKTDLVKYISNRKIDIRLARIYCSELHYSVYGKKYAAIAFKNLSNGFVLRNHNFKGCTCQDISIINGTTPKNNTINIYEGFFNYLSHLEIEKKLAFNTKCMVLNSLSNIQKAKIYLHKTGLNPVLYLDHDESAYKVVREIKTEFKNSVDNSHFYKDYNDLNDYLIYNKS